MFWQNSNLNRVIRSHCPSVPCTTQTCPAECASPLPLPSSLPPSFSLSAPAAFASPPPLPLPFVTRNDHNSRVFHLTASVSLSVPPSLLVVICCGRISRNLTSDLKMYVVKGCAAYTCSVRGRTVGRSIGALPPLPPLPLPPQ